MRTQFKTWLYRFCRIFSWQRFANVLAGLIVFYLLFAYFAVNPIAKKIIPSIANESLNSVASVNHVAFDPYRLKLTVDDFLLSKKDNNEKLIGFKQLIVDFELSGLFDLAWKFKQIAIAEPRIDLALAADGQLNWDALLAKLKEGPEEPPSDTIPSVIIERFIVSKGTLHYVDATNVEPVDMSLTPLSFQLKGFSTVPKDRGDYFISAAFSDDGGILKWKGDMGVNPVASTGLIALEGVKLAETLALVKGLSLPIDIKSGEVYTSFNYDFSMPKSVATVNLSDVKLGIKALAGDLVDGGHVDLEHAGMVVNAIHFVNNEQPEVKLQQIDVNTSEIKASQPDGSAVLLNASNVSLPQLDFFIQDDKPQLLFNDLNITLLDLNLQQGETLHVHMPESTLNALNVDLLQSTVTFNDMVVSNMHFGEVFHEASAKGGAKGKDLATLNSVTVSDGSIDLAAKKIGLQSITLDGLTTSVLRNGDGTINWVELLNKAEQSSSADPSAQATQQLVDNKTDVANQDAKMANEAADGQVGSESWTIHLPKLALNNGNVHIQDNGAPEPVMLDVQDISVALENVSLDMSKPLPITAAFKLKQGGVFSTKGQLTPSPLMADLGLKLSQASLKPFAPYINQYALLKLDNGNANLSGKLNVSQNQALALVFNGGFDIKQLAVVEEKDDKPFLSWNRLGSDQLKFSLAPNALKIGTLKIDQPSAKLIINQDKTTNISRILRSNEATQPNTVAISQSTQAPLKASTTIDVNKDSLIKSPAPADAEEVKPTPIKADLVVDSAEVDAFPVSIDSVRFNDAKLAFADLSLTPQFGTNVHSLNGVINGLSTNPKKVAQVEMAGKVDAYGSAKINGSLQPFNVTEFTDIKLAFTNLEMNNLTAYSGKFAGRYIESGKLSVDLDYKIKQQQLLGENKFVINQLKLGQKVKSDTAADLPLDLAIAILEDSNGVIDLDLPISGSLEDPDFSFAGIAWKAFRNVLTKIVTAPFRVLGKLFGGDGEDFDGIAFEPGQSEVSPPELEKLTKVSAALQKRQGLLLGVVPSYSKEVDTLAIKEQRYRKKVIEEMGVALEEGQQPGPIDLGNEDVQDAIDTLYNQLTNKGLFKRLASSFKEPEEGHYEKAQIKLIDSIEVSDADLNALAQARAKAIESALLTQGLNPDRLSIAPVIDVKPNEKMVKTTLNLEAKASAKQKSDADALKDQAVNTSN